MTADQLEGSIFASYSDAFAANVGQADERIDFLAQSDQVDFLFGSDTITLLLPSASPPLAPLSVIRPAPPMTPTPAFDAFKLELSSQPQPANSVVLQMSFPGADPEAIPVGQDQLSMHFGINLGDDPRRWFNNIPLYDTIVYPNLIAESTCS